MAKYCLHALALSAATSVPLAAQAQTLGPDQRTVFELQVFDASVRSTLQDDGISVTQPGTPVQAEDELGLPRRKTFAGLAFGRRIGERWRFEAEAQNLQRGGSAVLQRDITVDGYTYAAGTGIDANVSIRIARLNAGWTLLRGEGNEAGIVLGGQFIDTRVQIDGPAVDSFGNSSSGRHSGGDFGFVPLVGGYGTLALAPTLSLTGRLGVGLSDHLIDASAGLQWRPSPNFSIGAGYRAMRAQLDITTGVISGVTHLALDYRIRGPQLVLAAGF